jgi:hypothetical protein
MWEFVGESAGGRDPLLSVTIYADRPGSDVFPAHLPQQSLPPDMLEPGPGTGFALGREGMWEFVSERVRGERSVLLCSGLRRPYSSGFIGRHPRTSGAFSRKHEPGHAAGLVREGDIAGASAGTAADGTAILCPRLRRNAPERCPYAR